MRVRVLHLPLRQSGIHMSEQITLKDYIDDSIANIKESVKIAYASMEKRLEGMNEFRDTLRDQASKFITRLEMEAKFEVIQKQVDELRLSKATLEGKASQTSVMIALVFSIIGLAIGLIGLFLKL